MGFSKLDIVKFAVSSVVGFGTKKIVGDILKAHVAPPTNQIEKVAVVAASWVISGMITAATKKFTDDGIDSVVETVTKATDEIKTNVKLSRINAKTSTFEKEGLDQSRYRKDDTTGKWIAISEEDWKDNQGMAAEPATE